MDKNKKSSTLDEMIANTTDPFILVKLISFLSLQNEAIIVALEQILSESGLTNKGEFQLNVEDIAKKMQINLEDSAKKRVARDAAGYPDLSKIPNGSFGKAQ